VFVLANLAAGVTTLLPEADLRHVGAIDPAPVLRQIEAHRPTRSTASPALFARLIETGASLPTLTKLFTGGAPVFPSILDRLTDACPNARIVCLYGSTEAEPIAELDWADATGTDRQRMRTGGGLLVGAPVPRCDVRIIADHAGEPIASLDASGFEAITRPTGEVGQIIVAGDHVVPGYLDGRGEARTKIRVDGRVWHRTGDAGCLDERGRLWLLGRASAKICDDRGTIWPFAAECAADGIEGLRRTALIAHAAQRWLVVEAAPDRRKRVEAQIAERLAWAAIDRFVHVDRVPVDRRHHAKVDYPALRAMINRIARTPQQVKKGRST
jgi:acyl-CoA synthetase (AMP-forming)/AMP-acid ligase II